MTLRAALLNEARLAATSSLADDASFLDCDSAGLPG
jgi:hypothetical protein